MILPQSSVNMVGEYQHTKNVANCMINAKKNLYSTTELLDYN